MDGPMLGITGADGFIGSHLVDFLKKREIPHKPFFEGGSLKSFLQDVDILTHLAGRALPPDEMLYQSNVDFTRNLMDAAFEFPIKKVIYLSTVAVYGNGGNPKDVYSKTKLQAEKIIKSWGKRTGGKAVILRPFNVYGPRNKKGLIYQFYKSIKDTGFVTIYGDGSMKRDFLYIDDLVKVLIKAIDINQSLEADVVSGKQFSLLEVVEMFKKIMREDIDVVYKNEDPEKPKNIEVNFQNAKKILNWQAETEFERGLEKTLAWYKKNDEN